MEIFEIGEVIKFVIEVLVFCKYVDVVVCYVDEFIKF